MAKASIIIAFIVILVLAHYQDARVEAQRLACGPTLLASGICSDAKCNAQCKHDVPASKSGSCLVQPKPTHLVYCVCYC
ncbi:hypothetical protein RND81_12G004500 [Saponaria officinalis]|uniref:Uncharacterized protein n=1 Tax=Saponaria officinalis TaxID=3572 RepID=A0AAW1H719_SAPOF